MIKTVQCVYPEGKGIKDIQQICFEILTYFDEFCKANNLTYYLSGGTLLGAIRHKGFIPWDDDADVMMLRPDYEKLLSLSGQLSERYRMSECRMDSEYTNPWARIWKTGTCVEWQFTYEKTIGVFIDVFPIDTVPEGLLQREFYYFTLRYNDILRKAINHIDYTKEDRLWWIKRVIQLIAKKLGHPANYYCIKMNRILLKYFKEDGKLVGATAITHYGQRETMPRKLYKGVEFVSFCGKKFPVPQGYDYYLRRLYGNYMKLPPHNKHFSRHVFQFTKL